MSESTIYFHARFENLRNVVYAQTYSAKSGLIANIGKYVIFLKKFFVFFIVKGLSEFEYVVKILALKFEPKKSHGLKPNFHYIRMVS